MKKQLELRDLSDVARRQMCSALYMEATRLAGLTDGEVRGLMLRLFRKNTMASLTLSEFNALFAYVGEQAAKRTPEVQA